MTFLKKTIRSLVRLFGYDITKRHSTGKPRKQIKSDGLGQSHTKDMRLFLNGERKPVIFDVGANKGQSVDTFREAFPDPIIHSFEPSPSTYKLLHSHCKDLDSVKTWNCGVGSKEDTLPFLENTYSDWSSFLEPSEFAWGEVKKTTNIDVVTLDSFASKENIDFIHILKSDTQGYDLEVFKGATELMKENRIALIYFEVIFSDMYKGLPSFHEVFRFLLEHNFSLVTFYDSFFQENLLSWTDALFVNRDYMQRNVEQVASSNADSQ